MGRIYCDAQPFTRIRHGRGRPCVCPYHGNHKTNNTDHNGNRHDPRAKIWGGYKVCPCPGNHKINNMDHNGNHHDPRAKIWGGHKVRPCKCRLHFPK